ncbi:uncharacterized protein IWZ02DRAFT_186190 [Phyllosticta citriasiana]|uniref:uncharacterized protein n=1 Tax=Phyllosticta citriasiana TaxID=595635 RepID=UPI0030FDB392
MQQNSAPSADNAQNNSPPPSVEDDKVYRKSELATSEPKADIKHDYAIEEAAHMSTDSTRGNGKADTAAPAASSKDKGSVGEIAVPESDHHARTIDHNTAKRHRVPLQRSIPRFRGGGGSPRSPVARSKDFIRRLFDRKKGTKYMTLGTPYSSLTAKTPPNRSSSCLDSASSQGSPSLLGDQASREQRTTERPCGRVGQSEVDRTDKGRRAGQQEFASRNKGMIGSSPGVDPPMDAALAPGKSQKYESAEGSYYRISQGDGSGEGTTEDTRNQQHRRYCHDMPCAPSTMDIPEASGRKGVKCTPRAHEIRSRVESIEMVRTTQESSKLAPIPRPTSLPDILRHQAQSSPLRSTPAANSRPTLNARVRSKDKYELERAENDMLRIASSCGTSWGSSETLCSVAPSRSSLKETVDVANPSESKQFSAFSTQQQQQQQIQPLQRITNDTRINVHIPPRLTAATEGGKPGTAAGVDRCSGPQRSNFGSLGGPMETCLNSSPDTPPPPPPPGGAITNIVVDVETTTNPFPAAAATRVAPDATSARDSTATTALMRGGGRRPRLDPDAFAPPEPDPAPQASRGRSATSSPSAPRVGPMNATNAAQTSSSGSPSVDGCGGDYENHEVSTSSASCDCTGTSSVVNADDDDNNDDGSSTDVDDVGPDFALASSCGSSPGTAAAAIAVEVTSFPCSLLRCVDVVRLAAAGPTTADAASKPQLDIDNHVPSRTSSLESEAFSAPRLDDVVDAGELAVADATSPTANGKECDVEGDTEVDNSSPSQSSRLRLSLEDQPIRSPKRQAKPWWETSSGSAENDFVTCSEGEAGEVEKEELVLDGPTFCCGGGTGHDGVWDGDEAVGTMDVGIVDLTVGRRKRDGRRERADRCSMGSWISME